MSWLVALKMDGRLAGAILTGILPSVVGRKFVVEGGKNSAMGGSTSFVQSFAKVREGKADLEFFPKMCALQP